MPSKYITFLAVNANDITDNLSIRISSIDGLPAEQASKQKQISIMPREEFNRVHSERLKITAADKGLVITARIIPYGVTAIGNSAFQVDQVTSVIIPNSVTYIRGYAFEYTWLTSITIGSNVNIHSTSFEYGFVYFYNRNGKKAGTYTYNRNTGRWSFTPR